MRRAAFHFPSAVVLAYLAYGQPGRLIRVGSPETLRTPSLTISSKMSPLPNKQLEEYVINKEWKLHETPTTQNERSDQNPHIQKPTMRQRSH